MERKLIRKNILITGCLSGIDLETARALFETGATLFLTARYDYKAETNFSALNKCIWSC
ncbi:hypothetical protein GT037_008864 [Alternaria burnsii]|uniref:Uncharacterized protein n=1 Tax=Alternaria burnsii TaxID=1187904 RepID=A0A8H7AWH8_9PLEO|nr:uncharacterized protein GT037_008864 [Alternaria burnsii]KAF7672913.1 hypothetical protein GT037_008864 [Alternaria burnsii]